MCACLCLCVPVSRSMYVWCVCEIERVCVWNVLVWWLAGVEQERSLAWVMFYLSVVSCNMGSLILRSNFFLVCLCLKGEDIFVVLFLLTVLELPDFPQVVSGLGSLPAIRKGESFICAAVSVKTRTVGQIPKTNT